MDETLFMSVLLWSCFTVLTFTVEVTRNVHRSVNDNRLQSTPVCQGRKTDRHPLALAIDDALLIGMPDKLTSSSLQSIRLA